MVRALLLIGLVLPGCKGEPSAKAEVVAPPQPKMPEPQRVPDRAASLVTVVCSGFTGPGFFSAPDRVVTRDAAACDAPRVRLFDGRTLLAKVLTRQRDGLFLELEVMGGEGAALPLADGTALAAADDVFVPGGPRGTVRDPHRVRLGVPHHEVAFDRVPSPGSLVLDRQGRGVGVVVTDSLVLPVAAAERSAQWNQLWASSRPAAADELSELKHALGTPGLASAVVDASGKLRAVLLSRSTAASEVTVHLQGCDPTVKVAWEPFRSNAWWEPRGRDLLQFIDKNDLHLGLSMSIAEVPAEGCGGPEVRLQGALAPLERAVIAKTSQKMASTREAQPPKAEAPPLPPVEGPDERTWRGRFAALAAEREAFEAELRVKAGWVEQADQVARSAYQVRGVIRVLTPSDRERYEQYKRDLENAERDRAVLQGRLDDLEREASNVSVPREWRR